ncbi:GNAT family N-acetyltransferase [Zavarzinia compransoris]|uniref:N-acetyltransferase n=1 Tax=Zavarzinia compransoris TaxID=1264899 RepID=A0A317ED14_9PROT|nr:N-acetyltransferase [Zavarzinia compransoris]PWR23105.1 N-acetyltransferase [Zavarzinia compransoris]TDP46345.1 putative acetyltransferase [Zavarzinia compransoris]
MDYREAVPADDDAIAALTTAAFGQPEEAELVAALARDGDVELSLVAVEGETVVGHILYSDLGVVVDGRPVRAVALAPVSVVPGRQGRGIGAALVRASLGLLRDRGIEAVVVLGHARYYPRFGFSAALAAKLEAPFAGDAFMALELRPGALAGHVGAVHYARAFGL